MGLKPDEVKALTFQEFNLMWTGYAKRQENDWNIARHTWAYIISFAGNGLKKDAKVPKPTELWHLPHTDFIEDTVVKIRTKQQALQLINTF